MNPEPKKKKWLHALGLVPMSAMGADQLAACTGEATESPYPYTAPVSTGVHKGGESGKVNDPALDGDESRKRKRTEHIKEQRQWVSEKCWFCMASPQFESHLVTSVGDEVYACLAKGPLLPMHSLLLPIAHKPCSLFFSDTEAAEMDRYTAALRRCFAARGASLILFERYMANGTFEHAHLQAVPVPTHLAEGARSAFEVHGRKLGVSFEVGHAHGAR